MYTVQVLLSTYNGEAYLKEQLDSILNQKNVAVKLFVRDDGSSDGTVDILNGECVNISYPEFYHDLYSLDSSRQK